MQAGGRRRRGRVKLGSGVPYLGKGRRKWRCKREEGGIKATLRAAWVGVGQSWGQSRGGLWPMAGFAGGQGLIVAVQWV